MLEGTLLGDLRDDALLVGGKLRVARGERAHPGHVRGGGDPGRPDHVLVFVRVRPGRLVPGLLDLGVLGCIDLRPHGTDTSLAGPADQLGVPGCGHVLGSQLPALEPAQARDRHPVVRDPAGPLTAALDGHHVITMAGGGASGASS